MKKNGTFFGIFVIAVLSGCARESMPRWDQQFGESVRITQEQQTIPPTSKPPPLQIDGVTARNTLDAYQQSSNQAPTPTQLIPSTTPR